MIKAVIFDLDDVLFDEKEFAVQGFMAVAKYLATKHNLERRQVFRLLRNDFKRGVRKRNFDVLLDKTGLRGERVSNLVRIYREHQPSLTLHPDAKGFLTRSKGTYKFGIITDGPRNMQLNKISSLGLRKYMDVVTINERKEDWKPNTRSFKVTLTKLQVKPREAIYVGDNPSKDFIGCKRIGLHTVRIRRGGGEYHDLLLDKRHEADRTISNLRSLGKIIREIDEKTS